LTGQRKTVASPRRETTAFEDTDRWDRGGPGRVVAPSGFACCYITKGYITEEEPALHPLCLQRPSARSWGDSLPPTPSREASDEAPLPALPGSGGGRYKTPSLENGRVAGKDDQPIHKQRVSTVDEVPPRFATGCAPTLTAPRDRTAALHLAESHRRQSPFSTAIAGREPDGSANLFTGRYAAAEVQTLPRRAHDRFGFDPVKQGQLFYTE